MRIENIRIKNFRNLKQVELRPGAKFNFIIGDNAQGKTNFIESIYTTALLKSFRSNNISELIQKGHVRASIEIDLKHKVNNNIKFLIEKNGKKIFLNNKSTIKKNYFEIFNIIIFHPEEVNYISSYPLFRRNLIDRSIFYTNYKYIDIYKKYIKSVKQRNNILKKDSVQISVWEQQIIKYGSLIIKNRIDYIERLNNFLDRDDFKTTKSETYQLKYSRESKSIQKIEEDLEEEFSRKRDREKLLGYTLVGPHKDDIHFLLGRQPAAVYASQGQKRSLVISFKTAQMLDYQSIHGYQPILILDDMTSELDQNRKNALMDNLLENSGQVFVTSTDFAQNSNPDQSRVFQVNSGDIRLMA